jgi:hypothetical protein
MSVESLARQCADAINNQQRFGVAATEACITSVTPPGWKRPKGFPRGELLMDQPYTQNRVWRYNASRMLAWMDANGLVQVVDADSEALHAQAEGE